MGQPADGHHLSKKMTDSRRGLILINTGPGKGKTTAAMGTALRAVGNGMKVLMLQFLKGSWHYGELDAVKAFGEFRAEADGPGICEGWRGGDRR
jgi:ATP:corrinoid adenosyltransferase